MLVEQPTENGVVELGALYESPYSDAAPAGIHFDAVEFEGLIVLIQHGCP